MFSVGDKVIFRPIYHAFQKYENQIATIIGIDKDSMAPYLLNFNNGGAIWTEARCMELINERDVAVGQICDLI